MTRSLRRVRCLACSFPIVLFGDGATKSWGNLLAKEYIQSKKDISKDDLLLLSKFGPYTLEGLIVYKLGVLYYSPENAPEIRISTLIEQLDSSVRRHSLLLDGSKKQENSGKRKKKGEYPFGKYFVEFMLKRELIKTINKPIDPQMVKTKKGHFYSPTGLYAVCNFDISLLPIKLNLPMICKPLDWKSYNDVEPRYISDLYGGYLSKPMKYLYARYRMLTSPDTETFYLDISKTHRKLCNVINSLQQQPFRVHKTLLDYIHRNEGLLVIGGLLMPQF